MPANATVKSKGPAPCGPKRRSRSPVDPQTAATCSGLRYMLDDKPGYTRHRSGKNFIYKDTRGRVIRNAATLERIRALVIPPAWKNVWISPHANSHLQVTGTDARGRKQYRYHEKWRTVRDQSKFERLITFSRCLPRIRETVRADLEKSGLPREKVIATVVRLLETTYIRVGSETYARNNESYGLTTLRNHHVTISKCDVNFSFKGKSGREHEVKLTDCSLAEIVRKCRARSGELLFQYTDETGADRNVTSTDVNRYLRTISGQSVTAKDFRTWWGSVLAGLALKECEPATSKTDAKRKVSAIVKQVAEQLGNTPAICRKCYIHPAIIEGFNEAKTIGRITKNKKPTNDSGSLLPEEKAFVRFLKTEWR